MSGPITLSAGQNSEGESVNLTLSSSVYSSSYRNYEEEAKEIVKSILQQALKVYQSQLEKASIQWPLGKDFTIEKGKAAIDKFVKTWEVGVSWKYCIDYMHQEGNKHCFAVKYSEPTRRRPVPKATASVYFHLVNRGKELPVLVMYVMEGQRLAHTPQDSVFHEVWLRNVIANKLAVTEPLNIMEII